MVSALLPVVTNQWSVIKTFNLLNMKIIKSFIFPVLLLSIFNVSFAQGDKSLDKIEAAGKKHTAITGALTQVRTTASKAKIDMAGTLSYTDKSQFAINYSTPAGNRTVINGQNMLLIAKGKTQKFNLQKNQSMQKLATFLLDAMGGRVRAIANANNADYTVSEAGGSITVQMTARKKAAKGYSSIRLVYRQSDCVMTEMETVEFNGVSNLYKLSGIKVNAAVDAAAFKF